MGGIERNPQVCINHLDQNLFSWITLMDTLMIYMDLFFITVIFSSSGLLEKQLVLHKVDFLPTSCVCVGGGSRYLHCGNPDIIQGRVCDVTDHCGGGTVLITLVKPKL